MPMMKRVLGLDLGTYALKAVELRQTFRGLEPVQFRVQPRATDEVPLGEQVAQLVGLHELPTEHVCCAMASDRVTVHPLSFPFRDKKRLAQTVPFEIESMIPFRLEDIVVDWDLVASDAKSASVVAALTQRRDISRLLDELEGAGCEPRVLEAEGLALGNLASTFDLPGRRLLVDLGHSKTTLCLLMDGKACWSRSFRIGGRAITEAIARDLGWSLEQSERWKCEDGIFSQELTSRAPSALQELDRIAREVVRSLDAVEPLIGGPAETGLDCITLVGGGARLHRIDEYLTGRTGMVATRLGLPQESENAGLVAGGDPVLFAPALALALRATARAQTGMNFRQDEFAYRTDLSQLFGSDLRPTAILAGTAVAFLAASVASSTMLESGRADNLSNEAEAIYASTFPGEEIPSDPVHAMGNALQSAQQRADFIGVYEANQSALDLLTLVSEAIPSSIDVVFDEVTIDPKVVRIKVTAKSFEAPDRVVEALRSREAFALAKVTGETKKVKSEVLFSVTIPLAGGDEE